MSSSRTEIEQEVSGDGTQPLLQFITYSSDAAPLLGREARGAVRAHVTRRQHRQKRKTEPFQAITWTAPTTRTTVAAAADKSCPTPRPRATRANKSSSDESTEDARSGSSTSSSVGARKSLDFSENSSRSMSISPIPDGSTQEDPFWQFPVDWSPLFPPIMAHYIQNLAQPNANLDKRPDTCLLRTHWFPMAMASPASVYAVLLMAASHYWRAFGSQGWNSPRSGKDAVAGIVVRPEIILVLKARALNEVNRCLKSDDVRIALGDTTLGAVAKLAAFEAIFGDQDAYRQHMYGLRQMLQVRTTLGDAIGSVDAFLARLVTWIDVNAAHFTGMPGQNLLDTGVDISEPDLLHFAGTDRDRSELQLVLEPPVSHA
ncbi:hypothetical protein CLAFUW4_11025 [Fulvia fulva]|uniref:Uncharacterized protein n=1 Tax=Passalora fulva TaxID=5499 RepID=A0A9Q8URD0_PASFU|nr:uncharacterized protein CLAFUR5_10067 [Fulvia fulva]KAK4619949.1 hypothetical protein CLAFUR4_11030 [Fulvia fulva]KAK4620744.1 hypothetical protein CLAFUR0_11036 [Fulvia fulva]UJO19586.1 hypothetical protein CLAFUR5_10067 [Fulvia fulva]WPV17415.1 hypothetical protein CLAFUW4_11025 [Fulvia fulva]WPV32555.1 hypothetical protein CLAFUW7_11022 [Fulvia fulva]